MKLPHDKFCVLPWISLETSPIGTVRPCCLAEEEIVDNTGTKFNLNTARFTEIQDSNYMKNLRQQFLDQQQPETCRKCWQEENAGRTSKRMHTLDRLKHMLPEQSWSADAKPLMFLDLKLGNICNLKCRICGSWSSSTFATEELQFVKDKKNSYHYQMLRQGAWPRENLTFWNEVDQVAQQIRYIEFTGGEPFMIQEHFDLLQGLVDRGLAGSIEIHYNTNGTQWPRQGPDIWKHFKTVEIAFSIDDVGSRFEYQRTNAVWNNVIDNIEKFKQIKKSSNNIQLQVCSTVNVFNVYYLEELDRWIQQQNFDFVYWNMMHEAWYFNISFLPDSVKQAVEQRLRSAQVSARTQQEFQKIIEFMYGNTGRDGTELCEQIAMVDRRRNQNFKSVSPEMATLLNYQL